MNHVDYIISGAGAAGLMLAYRMANDPFFDHRSILIIDPIHRNEEDRTWCFWESDAGEWEDIVSKSWDSIYVAHSSTHKKIPIAPYRYKMIQSKDFYDKVWTVLKSKSNIQFLQEEIKELIPGKEKVEVHTQKNKYETSKVFNSIPNFIDYQTQEKYPVLQQHFVGWFIETDESSFDETTATFMDFSIPQEGNTRFMYVLPFSKNEALVEYTLFSKDLLSFDRYEKGIKAYLDHKGITNYKINRKEQGAIPMTAYPFASHNSSNLLHIGTNGGWTKASTGYTFRNCSKKTKALIDVLKTGNDLKKFNKKSKFEFYDMLFLDVLASKNEQGGDLFTRLFDKTDIRVLLKFLDEDTNFKEDLSIMSAVPPFTFSKALLKRLIT